MKTEAELRKEKVFEEAKLWSAYREGCQEERERILKIIDKFEFNFAIKEDIKQKILEEK